MSAPDLAASPQFDEPDETCALRQHIARPLRAAQPQGGRSLSLLAVAAAENSAETAACRSRTATGGLDRDSAASAGRTLAIDTGAGGRVRADPPPAPQRVAARFDADDLSNPAPPIRPCRVARANWAPCCCASA